MQSSMGENQLHSCRFSSYYHAIINERKPASQLSFFFILPRDHQWAKTSFTVVAFLHITMQSSMSENQLHSCHFSSYCRAIINERKPASQLSFFFIVPCNHQQTKTSITAYMLLIVLPHNHQQPKTSFTVVAFLHIAAQSSMSENQLHSCPFSSYCHTIINSQKPASQLFFFFILQCNHQQPKTSFTVVLFLHIATQSSTAKNQLHSCSFSSYCNAIMN